MGRVLYSIIIQPLELFFQFIYGAAYGFIGNYGFSIIVLSLAMNILVFPLYKRADAIQNEERDIQKKMSKWVKHIKQTFSGDERYMELSTYYRENNYSTVYALRGSISLFLQIPFFIAAYRFLSNYSALRGASFGPIADLGTPDAMLHIFGITLNLLPILMTVINFISSAIYTRGFPLKSKIQLYVVAIVFLVLLYRSPAGLVFYWTLNNLFSLVKNVFYKLKHPGRVLCGLAAVVGIGLCLLERFVFLQHTQRQRAFILAISVALMLPLLVFVIRTIIGKKFEKTDVDIVKSAPESMQVVGANRVFFLLAGLGLTVLVGFLIPSAVISTSTQEFVDVLNPVNPAGLLVRPTIVAFGLFVFWLGVFYSLIRKELQGKYAFGVFSALIIAVVNYMFFGRHLGNLSPELVFDNDPITSMKEQSLNLVVLLFIVIVLWMIWKRKDIIPRLAAAAILIGLVGLSCINLVRINTSYKEMVAAIDSVDSEEIPVIPLSTEGKNVMIIMLDRAISGYIPYIMNEKPELLEKFSGFTYYPNTVSFGTYTNFGTPPLFGGYEYTPTEMNARSDELLVDKHDEALKVLPKLFSEEGYRVTIGDPPYARYQEVSDLSIYDDLKNTHAYHLAGFIHDKDFIVDTSVIENRKRNLLCYSILKSSPVVMQHFLYNGGQYFGNQESSTKEKVNNNDLFIKEFSVLKHLPDITRVQKTDENTLLVLQNCTTHQPTELQKPEYELADTVDNTKYNKQHADDYVINGKRLYFDNSSKENHYDVNMAALMKLGAWFDYLREMGIYDNTRIIIVADHGRGLQQFDKLVFDKLDFDAMWFNPLLMVKDFGEDSFKTSNEFMTNADVPYLATEQLFINPGNPYSGKAFDPSEKKKKLTIVHSDKCNVTINNGTVFDTDGGRWFTMHDSIFDQNNWNEIKEP